METQTLPVNPSRSSSELSSYALLGYPLYGWYTGPNLELYKVLAHRPSWRRSFLRRVPNGLCVTGPPRYDFESDTNSDKDWLKEQRTVCAILPSGKVTGVETGFSSRNVGHDIGHEDLKDISQKVPRYFWGRDSDAATWSTFF